MSKNFPNNMYINDGLEVMMIHIIEAMECSCTEKWNPVDGWIIDEDSKTCNRCAKLKELTNG